MSDSPLVAAFLATFESLRMGSTFARGRRDARAGHVRALTVSSSLAVALVRGPDDDVALRARIAVRAFGAAEWARVEDELAAQARFTADLLAGRMPGEVAAVFAPAGLSLLPLSLDEVAMDCACGRPMPCPHVAAAIYALAAAIESDPFLAFAWRGRGRDELLERLRQLRGAAPLERPADPDPGLGEIAAFWGADPPARPALSSRSGLLLDQLDPPPLTVDGRALVEVLRPAYQALADHQGIGA